MIRYHHHQYSAILIQHDLKRNTHLVNPHVCNYHGSDMLYVTYPTPRGANLDDVPIFADRLSESAAAVLLATSFVPCGVVVSESVYCL
jgi:hypothetical protein